MSDRVLYVATLAVVWAIGEADTGDLKDPMRPLTPGTPQSASVEQRFRLTATLISEARRVAVINGRSILVGGTVDGAQVTAVEASSVQLRVGTRTFEVSLGHETAGAE